jgi:plastocyanin
VSIARVVRVAATGLAWAFGVLLHGAPAQAVGVTITVNAKTAEGATPKDAVVVLDPTDFKPPPSHETAVIDQMDKQFVPQVTVVRTGTAVSFPNSDQIKHDVYSDYPPKRFELKLYAGIPAKPIVFDTPGLEALGCNVHDKMKAFVAIVDSPYFAKIRRLSRTGSVTVNVPPGHYVVHIWHPDLSLRVPDRTIEVKAEATAVGFDLDLTGIPDPTAAWPLP